MYTFTFLLLLSFAIYDIGFKKSIQYDMPILIALALWLVFHDGFRWEIGTDWEPYYNYFKYCMGQNDGEFEIGYLYLNRLVYFFTENYTVFLVLHAIILYGLAVWFIRKYAVNPFVVLFIFYCLMLQNLGMNRQLIAFAICLFSLQYVFDKKIIPFLICIVVAFLFHSSAWLFVPAYFLNRKIGIRNIIIVLAVVYAVSLSNVINYIPSDFFYLFGRLIGYKMELYIASSRDSIFVTTQLGILRKLIWISIALVVRNRMKDDDEHCNFFLNLYLVGVLFYILFCNTILHAIMARGSMYYSVTGEILLIPYILSAFKQKKLLLSLVAIYCAIVILKGFKYYADETGTDIYRPYKSVLDHVE